MALASTVGVSLIPMGERPQYGSPYPIGLAVAVSSIADDASGGAHTFSLNAPPGFIYRLELFNYTRGEATLRSVHCITAHRWAQDRIQSTSAALDLNWFLGGTGASGFSVYGLVAARADGGSVDAMQQLRRFPMGAAPGGKAPGVSIQLMLVTNEVNTDTITNELAIVWSYWKQEALYLPGFLSSFYEAPAVPPLVRQS